MSMKRYILEEGYAKVTEATPCYETRGVGRATQTVESGYSGSAEPQLLGLGQGIESLSLELHSEIEEPFSLPWG